MFEYYSPSLHKRYTHMMQDLLAPISFKRSLWPSLTSHKTYYIPFSYNISHISQINCINAHLRSKQNLPTKLQIQKYININKYYTSVINTTFILYTIVYIV